MKRQLAAIPAILCLMLLAACGAAPSSEAAGAISTTPPITVAGIPAQRAFPHSAELPPPSEPASEPPDPRQEAIDALLSQMTLEEKVGQMFFVRCPEANQGALVSQYHLGGYLLFERDFQDSAGSWLTAEQFIEKIESYQAASKIPLLIGVDEEGGTVARATRNPNLFPAKRKSPQAVFAQGGMEAIIQDTFDVNSTLLLYGINVNFTPVADLSTDPGDFIYSRTFGQDAAATAKYIETAVAWMHQCRVEGELRSIGSVLKHFPGYGSNADTHTGIAVDERPYEQFLAEDFLPFQAGIDAGAGSVMVSHNIVTCMDSALPASLSPEVHRVLREELSFEGVILTDNLAMGAVEPYARDGSAAVLAVLAGNDMIVTSDFEAQIPQVIAAAESGVIRQEIIDSAAARILGWKYDLGLIPTGELP